VNLEAETAILNEEIVTSKYPDFAGTGVVNYLTDIMII